MKRRPQYGKHAADSPSRRPRREQRDKWPLSPEHLAPRTFDLPEGPLPEIVVKSPTRSVAIFRKRVGDYGNKAQHGDVVQAVLPSGQVLGCGLFNPRAEAVLKMLTWDDEIPDASWWQARLKRAVDIRSELALRKQSNACRLIHGEADGLPGVVVDLFDNILSLEAYSLGMFQRAEAIIKELMYHTRAKHWYVRSAPNTLQTEGYDHPGHVSSKVPAKCRIEEHGLSYEVDFATGHKTGFFCDQRANRLRLREFCAGKTVLDACCYSGGFSLNAIAAGAREVTGVDLDENAVAMAKRNANLNSGQPRFIHADAFAYMRDMQRNGKTFDVVVLDPPKLILSRDEADIGHRKYYDFNRLAASLVAPNGILVTCSCSGLLSTPEFVKMVTAAIPFARQPQLLALTGADADHPVALNVSETEYLKCAWVRL
ncbi:MAG: class I SAM-dependent rRNA methyltransferase [Planctomycetaceae bacterium]